MAFTKNNILIYLTRAYFILMLLGMNKISAQGIRAGSVSLLTKGTFNAYNTNWPQVESRSYNYSVNLQGNYFIAENLSVALGYRYIGHRGDGKHVGAADTVHIIGRTEDFHGAFVQIRKYWFFNRYMAFFAQAGYGYGEGTSVWTGPIHYGGSESYAYQQHLVQVAPGLVVFPHPRFAIELNLGSVEFLSRKQQPGNSTAAVQIKRFDANLIPNLNIGFQYFLTKR